MPLPIFLASPPARASAPASFVVNMDSWLSADLQGFVNNINALNASDWFAVLGTVSETSGVPTGALIERGSNANGRYVRWADGTQLCQRTVTIDVGLSTRQDFTYPAAFAGTDSGAWSYSHDNPNVSIRPANIRSVIASNTQWSVRLVSTSTPPDPTTSQEELRLEAWGRWF